MLPYLTWKAKSRPQNKRQRPCPRCVKAHQIIGRDQGRRPMALLTRLRLQGVSREFRLLVLTSTWTSGSKLEIELSYNNGTRGQSSFHTGKSRVWPDTSTWKALGRVCWRR